MLMLELKLGGLAQYDRRRIIHVCMYEGREEKRREETINGSSVCVMYDYGYDDGDDAQRRMNCVLEYCGL